MEELLKKIQLNEFLLLHFLLKKDELVNYENNLESNEYAFYDFENKVYRIYKK